MRLATPARALLLAALAAVVAALPVSATQVFVSNQDDATVSVIDTDTDAVIATIKVGAAPASIAAARDGKRTMSADLYDGSEGGDKYYATTTAIGRQVSPGAKTTLAGLKDGDKLDRVPSWPVSIGYFKPAQGHSDGLPLYEMSYRFHENGVTSSLRIDHGEFAIKGDLKELSYLEAGKCPPEKP